MSGSGGSWANVVGNKRGDGEANTSARGRARNRVTYPVNVNLNLGGTSQRGAQPVVQDVGVNPAPTSQPTLPSTSVWGKPAVVPPSAVSEPQRVDSAETPKLQTVKLPAASTWGKPVAVPATPVPPAQRLNVAEIPKSQATLPSASVWGKPPVVAPTAVRPPQHCVPEATAVHTKQAWGKNSSSSVTTPKISAECVGLESTLEGHTSAKVEVQVGSQNESLQMPPNVWADRLKMSSLNISAPSFCPQTPLPADNVNANVQDAIPSTSASREVSTPKKEEQLTVVMQVNPKLHMLGVAVGDPNRIRPMRPKEAGSSGKAISLVANHFKVNLKNVPKKVYHYDVVITPKEGKGKGQAKETVAAEEAETTVPDRLLPVVWKLFEERFHTKLGARMPFDGKKNCYTAKPLRLGMSVWADEMTMTDPDDGDKTRTFRIQLKLANEVHTETMWTYLKSCTTWERCELPQEVIQALDVALRYRPMNKYTPCNRSFYSSEKPYAISDLLELWYGHNQSLLLGRDGNATLNIDMANKAFVKKMSVVKLLKIILNKDERSMELSCWTERQFRDAENFLKGKLIEYGSGGKHPDGSFKKLHRFVAVKICQTDADLFQFPMNGRMISIREHFLDKQVTLKHPTWPVVHIGNKNMTNYVPLELCEILPQAYKGKLEAEDTSRMIRGAATEPTDRFNRITKSRAGCEFETCQVLKEFGMEVNREMVQINSARKLPPPQIMFKNDRGVVQSQAPPRDDGKFVVGQFLQGAKIAKIGILNASGKNAPDFLRKIKDFARSLGREADSRGFQSISAGTSHVATAFADAHLVSVQARTVRGSMTYNVSVQEGLKDLKNRNCQLVLVIMSRDGKEYSIVKSEAEVKVGVLTQCIREETIGKVINKPDQARQILINVLLKINAKLNGVSFQLAPTITNEFGFSKEPILFLGADVTHPAPNSKSPSVAAITASYDISGICYSMHIQVQAAAQECINGLVGVIKRMICEFRDKTRILPKRIMMFRDGVSEGQFPQIKEMEYNEIKEACRLVQDGYNPKITFLIVKKRHHTRFRPVNARDAVRPKGNIPPGTVVDTVITHPTEMEFFLNSHVGIQGTSKPTRYHVLHDDSNFTMDALERLTYYLCYTFVRCTHPVSVPCVTYYAHIAAFRARALLEKEGDNLSLTELQARMTVKPELVQKYPMFYV